MIIYHEFNFARLLLLDYSHSLFHISSFTGWLQESALTGWSLFIPSLILTNEKRNKRQRLKKSRNFYVDFNRSAKEDACAAFTFRFCRVLRRTRQQVLSSEENREPWRGDLSISSPCWNRITLVGIETAEALFRTTLLNKRKQLFSLSILE